MVGILQGYCNSKLATRQLNDLVDRAHASTPTERPDRVISAKAPPRLTAEQVSDLIGRYQAGESLNQLSHSFKIRRETVAKHLTKAGIAIRPPIPAKLSEKQKDQIAELYQQGLSIRKLAKQFGVTDTPVMNALKVSGVTTRPRRGTL